jgi:hypothetical protein
MNRKTDTNTIRKEAPRGFPENTEYSHLFKNKILENYKRFNVKYPISPPDRTGRRAYLLFLIFFRFANIFLLEHFSSPTGGAVKRSVLSHSDKVLLP